MALSHKNQNQNSTSAKHGYRHDQTLSWAQIAQRQTLSYQPATKMQPSKDLSDSSSTASKYAHQIDDLLHTSIRPFIQGLEDDSTLIDITNIKDLNGLKQFFGSFDTDTYFPTLEPYLNRPHPTMPETLRREIDWFNDGKRMLRLTWDEMPPYCRYCHVMI
ncbi:uncharacterized protein B0P05DRAFT_642297 [Gilbertella persicaria]|uniref:uncharacterized protein n=1 Tax=Gilbertella persicaria TaxID=101096 RepID=UPI0022202E99|nr:uncharacterized protein B0P05DRAFT_642297 [Gilbertella persicaria]KAI8047422.1 hypothetical protein B0P05DRAFT_642297 [Gilbertella persicaria]